MRNIITKTGQTWKIILTLVIIFLAMATMSYGFLNINDISKTIFFLYVAVSATVGILAFIFTCVSIKCPKCGAKWFWSAVNSKESMEWALSLKSLTACPKCGETHGK